jgi:hypothetical protein
MRRIASVTWLGLAATLGAVSASGACGGSASSSSADASAPDGTSDGPSGDGFVPVDSSSNDSSPRDAASAESADRSGSRFRRLRAPARRRPFARSIDRHRQGQPDQPAGARRKSPTWEAMGSSPPITERQSRGLRIRSRQRPKRRRLETNAVAPSRSTADRDWLGRRVRSRRLPTLSGLIADGVPGHRQRARNLEGLIGIGYGLARGHGRADGIRERHAVLIRVELQRTSRATPRPSYRGNRAKAVIATATIVCALVGCLRNSKCLRRTADAAGLPHALLRPERSFGARHTDRAGRTAEWLRGRQTAADRHRCPHWRQG